MKARNLLNTQRKALHTMLVQAGVDPAQTRWTNDGKGWTHDDADTLEAGLCHFLFNPDHDGTMSVHFRPGLGGGTPQGMVNITWDQALNLFARWAQHVKEELTEEDPWLQYSAYVPPERLGTSTDNSPYTHREAEHVVESLRLLREYVKKQLPAYQEVAEQFDPQFERLANHARQGAGRIDWSNQFVGMLISLCMVLSLDQAAASALWKFWVKVVEKLILP